MKKILLPLLVLIVASCSKKNMVPPTLRTGNLESSFITIKPDNDYHLKTPKGAIITINSGTFSVASGKEIQLEIKEAYSARDIVLAGLTTTSNGKPLKTGGMIYFNATSDGEILKFQQPVSISIPTAAYDKEMQLFKGEYKADSSVNWIDPVPLDTTPKTRQLLWGEALFKPNCGNCHRTSTPFTGPSLANVYRHYPSRQWVYDFVHSPMKMMAKGDKRSLKLMNMYRPTVMTAFPVLTKQEIDAIMAYVDNEAALHPVSDSVRRTLEYDDTLSAYDLTDSLKNMNSICGYDTSYLPYPKTDERITDLQDADTTIQFSTGTSFSPPPPKAGLYDFQIDVSGWYNIDHYVAEGTTDVELKVLLNSSQEIDMEVYLFCPKNTTFLQGQSADSYHFNFTINENGQLPLVVNDEAIVFAFGSKDDKLYYAAGKFRIGLKQQIPIIVKETTKDKLKVFLSQNKIDGITLDIYTNEKIVTAIPCGQSPEADPSVK